MADMFNRFLGFSSDYVSQRFSRDNDQILALNYENTCDSEYLSRLFLTEGQHCAAGDSSNVDGSSAVVSTAAPITGLIGGASASTLQGESVSSNGGSPLNPTASSQSQVAVTPTAITNGLLSGPSLRNQNSHIGRVVLHDGTVLSCDVPEDISIFSSDQRMAQQFMRKRFISTDAPTCGDSQSTLASLIHRQMLVFEHISTIILNECCGLSKNSSDSSRSVITAPSSSSKKCVEAAASSEELPSHVDGNHFVAESLLSMLKAIEKQSRFRIEQAAIEPILALLISLFQQALSQQSVDSKSTDNGNFPLSELHLHYLRSILCNGTSQGIREYTSRPKVPLKSSNFSEIEEGLRLSFCCSFGLLAIAIYSRSSSDAVVSMTQLMFISSLCDELHETITQSECSTEMANFDNNSSVPAFPSPLFLDQKMRYKVKLLDAKGIGGAQNGKFSNHNKQLPIQSQTPPPSNKKGVLPEDLLTSLEDSRDFSDSCDSEKVSKTNCSNTLIKDKKNSNRDKIAGKLNFGKGKFDHIDAAHGTSPLVVNRVTVSKSVIPNSSSNNNKQSKDISMMKNNNSLRISDPSSLLSTPPSPVSPNIRSTRDRDLRSRLVSLTKIPKSIVRIVRNSSALGSAIAAKNLNGSNLKTSALDGSYVWSTGQNSYGELGHGDINQRRSFARISFFEGKCVNSIGAGNEHSIFVTQHGKMFVCGYNDNGQCGIGSMQQVRNPTAVSGLDGEDIAQVNVYNGCEHTLAITRDGKLYAFGYNYRGQLGLGSSSSESIPRPVKSLLSRRVVLAACSYHHSIMLCSDGVLMACGRNDCGQLGHGDNIDKKSPQPVLNSPKSMVSISCGQFHTVVSTLSGNVFVCGKNDYGQLGLESVDNVKVLSKLVGTEIESTKEVCCGYYHTLILSHSGFVTGCGRNDYGQLGLGHTQPRMHGLHNIQNLRDKNVTSVAAGCYHSIASTLNGMLYVFGRNNHGQLGSGDLEERHLPHPVDNFVGRRIVSVAAGFYHTLVLAADLAGDVLVEDGRDGVMFSNNNNNNTSGIDGSSAAIGDRTSSSLIDPNENEAFESPPPKLYPTRLVSTSSNNSNGNNSSMSGLNSRMTIGKLLNNLILQLDIMNTAAVSQNINDSLPPLPLSNPSSQIMAVSESWIVRQLGIFAELLSVTRAYLIDKSGTVTMGQRNTLELPLNAHECINLLRTLLKTIDLFLAREKQSLSIDLDNLSTKEKEDALNSFSKDDTILYADTNETFNASGTRSTLEGLLSIYSASATIFSSTDVNENSSFTVKLKAIAKLRKELLSTYFYLPSNAVSATSSVSVSVFQNICQDCVSVVFRHFDTLFPHSRIRTMFFKSMSGDLLNIDSIRPSEFVFVAHGKGSTPADLQKTLRLFTGLCFRFRGISEVIRLFRTSIHDGLSIFKNLLAVYCHVSLLCLDTKAQQHVRTPGGDISKTLAALEHCSTNFLKCAIPLIFARGIIDSNDTNDEESSHIRSLGESILADVFKNAESVFDHLALQPLTVDLLNVLRTGTVIPSILPTTLLFGMTGAVKTLRSTTFLAPLVDSLIRKLNMIGRSDGFAANGTNTESAPGASKQEQHQHLSENSTSNDPGDVQEDRDNNAQPSQSHREQVSADAKEPPSPLSSQNKEIIRNSSPSTTNSHSECLKICDQVSWWSRLMKLSTTLQTELAASLISTSCSHMDGDNDENSEDRGAALPSPSSMLICHPLWTYFHAFSIRDIKIDIISLTADSSSNNLRLFAAELAVHFRRQSSITDPSYRLLHQMGKAGPQIRELEEALFTSFVELSGYHASAASSSVGKPKDRWLDMGWKSVVSFCKRLHLLRSTVLNANNSGNDAANVSWIDVLRAVGEAVVSVHTEALVKCSRKLSINSQLPTLRGGSKAKEAFRRCVITVVCTLRWKNALRYGFKSFGDILIDFLYKSAMISTSNLRDVSLKTSATNNTNSIGFIVSESFSLGSEKVINCTTGISMLRSLLTEQFSVPTRTDVMAVLLRIFKVDQTTTDIVASKSSPFRLLSYGSVCCDMDSKYKLRSSMHELFTLVSNYISNSLSKLESIVSDVLANSNAFTTLDFNGLTLSLKVFHLLSVQNYASVSKYLQPKTLSKLFCIIEGKKKLSGSESSSDISSIDGKSSKISVRERTKAIRKVSNAIVSLLQELSVTEISRGCVDNSIYIRDLIDSHVELFNALRKSVDDKSSQCGGKSTTNSCTTSHGYTECFDDLPSKGDGDTPSKSHSLRDGRKRCQELISKPLEFCKSQEGYVLQGDKLLNNYKGIDFTMATWLLVTKKTTNKLSFITGKINHNDAWPLVGLRPDRKIEVIFGHGNEFDRISSVATIPMCVWTHVAVVVEPKKMKVYINGVLDCQAVTKGNARAILYPVVIGTCPLSVRTRVDHVRDGFDGLLSQFKYYTRSLSPIHLHVIYDLGPPEEYDGKEMWMYQLMSSADRLARRCEIDGNPGLTHIANLLLHILISKDGKRLRSASLKVLSRLLARDCVKDIDLTADVGASSSICSIPLLSVYSTFRQKIVYYFILMTGLCMLPSLANRCESASSSPDFSNNNNAGDSNFLDVATNNEEDAANSSSSSAIISLLLISPLFLSKKATKVSPTFVAVPIVSSGSIDGNATRDELTSELAYNLVILLRYLGSTNSEWADAISFVSTDILNKYSDFLRTNPFGCEGVSYDSDLTGCSILGVCELLGGSQAEAYIGSSSVNYFGDAVCTVLNVNKTTNSACVIAWNTNGTQRVISNVRLSDLSVSPMAADNATANNSNGLRCFITPPLLTSALDVLDSTMSFTQLSLSDVLCVYRPDHPFPRNTLLKLTRPFELHLSHKLLKCITSPNMHATLASHVADELAKPSRKVLVMTFIRASVRAIRSNSSTEEVFADRSLNLLWQKASKYIAKVASGSKVKLSDFPCDDIEKPLTDYVGKYLGISTESYSGTSHDKLLKQGLLIELLHSVSSGNQSSQHECVNSFLVDSGKVSLNECGPHMDQDISDSDSVSALRLVYQLRKAFIAQCRLLVQFYGSDLLGKSALAHLPLSWKVVLFHSLSNDHTCTFYTAIARDLFTSHTAETTQHLSSSLRYGAISFLQQLNCKSTGNLLESTDVVSRMATSMSRWIDIASSEVAPIDGTIFQGAANLDASTINSYENTKNNAGDICFHILKTLLPSLSFIESAEMEIQLLELCQKALRVICLRMITTPCFSNDGVSNSFPKELFDLAKSNYFTLIRARAQEHLAKQRGSIRVNINPMAHCLVQIAVHLEIIQRRGCMIRFNQHHSIVVSSNLSWLNNISSIKTSIPKIAGVHSTSVDADLTQCVDLSSSYNACSESNSTPIQFAKDAILVEVAIGVCSDGEETIFDTIYYGSSLRFIQSGLASGCSYVLRCRAWYGDRACKWSDTASFKTDSALLFAFDPAKCGSDILLSDDGLSASYAGDDSWSTILGTQPFTSGLTSWEIRITQSSTAYIFVGVAASQADLHTFLGGCQHGWGFIGEQALYHNREKVKVYGEPFGAGDVVGVVLDLNVGVVSFTRNGRSLGVAFDGIYGELYPAVAFYNVGQELEILVESLSSTCALEPAPSSPSQLNIDHISLLTEMSLSLKTRSALPRRLLEAVCDQCNDWCSDAVVRARATSGMSIFLKTKSPILSKLGLSVGSRIRTTLGIGKVVGEAFGRLWCRNNDKSQDAWFFSHKQITTGRAHGLFLPCTYDSPSSQAESQFPTESHSGVDTSTFDPNAIQDFLEPSKWSPSMDNVLTSFLLSTSSSNKVSPFDVTVSDVCTEFRSIQQQLSRIVLASPLLSQKWGFAGPKRKAVIARLSVLRYFNHSVDQYLPSMMVGDDVNCFSRDSVINQGFCTTLGNSFNQSDDFSPTITTIPSEAVTSFDRPSLGKNIPCHECAIDSHFVSSRKLPQTLAGTLSTDDVCTSDFNFKSPFLQSKQMIFTELKLVHFWEIVTKSASKAAKTEDDYDYPADLPQLRINRIRAYRSREASTILNLPGEDLLLPSIVSQLWTELRKHASDKLRLSYTHPMDDGQSRAFKIKFDGEGVDDYGGPYREIFQQVCDELQALTPKAQPAEVTRSSNDKDGSEGVQTCFLPILMPTPNWSATCDCTEKYKFMFNPSSCSPFRIGLCRFIGQFIGVGIRSKITLDLAFPSAIWKILAGETLSERDLESYDKPAADFITLLGSLNLKAEIELSGNPTVAGAVNSPRCGAYEDLRSLLQDLTWTAIRCDGNLVELVPGGKTRPVLMHEVREFIQVFVECRLQENCLALEAVREGIMSVIPENAISLLCWHELEKVVCGDRYVDVDRLKENTEYDDDVSPDDPHILMFWEVLAAFSESEKSAFLRFVWARPTLPPSNVAFPQKFKMQSAVGDDAVTKPDTFLPKAHTCFFSINLPRYTDKKILEEKLKYAILNCTEMDADFRTVETDVPSWNNFQ